MKILLSAALYAAVALAFPSPCHGQATGAKVMQYCAIAIRGLDANPPTEISDLRDSSTCIGMVQGVEGTLIRIEGVDRLLHESLANTACFPDGYSTAQGLRVAFKYMQQHPERLNEAGVALIYDALTETFPCKPTGVSPQRN